MKYKLTVVAFLVSLGAIGYLSSKLYLEKKKPKVLLVEHSQIIDEAKTEVKILSEKIDKKGFKVTVAERKEDIISNGDITKLPISKSVFDSLRLDNIDKSKRLQQATLINARLEILAVRVIKKIDSLKNVSYNYKDEFFNVSFRPDSISGTFDITGDIKLIKQDYKNRKNFFSPYHYYTDILTPDKRITINGLQSLTIKAPTVNKFGIGLQLGYAYQPLVSKFTPSFGFGVSYNFMRF